MWAGFDPSYLHPLVLLQASSEQHPRPKRQSAERLRSTLSTCPPYTSQWPEGETVQLPMKSKRMQSLGGFIHLFALLHWCASKMRRLVKCAVLYSIFSTVTPHPPGLLNRDTHADTDQSGRSSLQALCDIWGCVWCRGVHCAGGGRHGPFCVRGPFYSGPCANTLRSALSLLTQQRTRWLYPLLIRVKRAIPDRDDVWCVRQCK